MVSRYQKFLYRWFQFQNVRISFEYTQGCMNFDKTCTFIKCRLYIFKKEKKVILIIYTCQSCKGLAVCPSINDVTHFLRFLTPPSPLSPILLKRLKEQCHLFVDSPLLPKWVTSFEFEFPAKKGTYHIIWQSKLEFQ